MPVYNFVIDALVTSPQLIISFDDPLAIFESGFGHNAHSMKYEYLRNLLSYVYKELIFIKYVSLKTKSFK